MTLLILNKITLHHFSFKNLTMYSNMLQFVWMGFCLLLELVTDYFAVFLCLTLLWYKVY